MSINEAAKGAKNKNLKKITGNRKSIGKAKKSRKK
jgi:hypothetical protein